MAPKAEKKPAEKKPAAEEKAEKTTAGKKPKSEKRLPASKSSGKEGGEKKGKMVMEFKEGEQLRARVTAHRDAAAVAWKDGGSSRAAFGLFLSDVDNHVHKAKTWSSANGRDGKLGQS
uniref:Uncharacterized protein n=1 Tax=Zea mays TaxID=4577 RepID=B6TCC7_MAIZE|nr:hypothetical protein [Zea mays]